MPEMKPNSRREFLKQATAGAVVAGAAATGLATPNQAFAAGSGARLAMVIDLRRCIGCRGCSVACKTENNVPLGVWNAAKITALAREFGKAKKACVISYRGAVAHYHGADTERAIQMLAMITGNVNTPGGRCNAVGGSWKYPKPKNTPKAKKLDIFDGDGTAKIPTHHVSQGVIDMIKDGSHGRPAVVWHYTYNPVYTNGDFANNQAVYQDEKLIPYFVSSNIVYDETSSLADLILPDVTYLERWDWDDMASPIQRGEWYVRQPLVTPLGEARDMCDVVCYLAKKLGLDLGVDSKLDFVQQSHALTAKDLKEKGYQLPAGDFFEYMKKHGVFSDPSQPLAYHQHEKKLADKDLKADGVILDEQTGVYWNWKKAHVESEAEARKKGYAHTKKSYSGYVGQNIGETAYKGFAPDKLNKTGYFEIYSEIMEEKGFNPLPSWTPIPEHAARKSDELYLTTYKVAVHIHSRSAHTKLLSEMYHDNPGWINPATAAKFGIKDGDQIKLESPLNSIVTKARVTERIVPDTIAISYHLGRSESGRYASGRTSPFGHNNDPDLQNKWWTEKGVHPNPLMTNSPDPISGQCRFMDNVVKISKA
jgi:anaerobic selenocysteine-containing dehydrogenase